MWVASLRACAPVRAVGCSRCAAVRGLLCACPGCRDLWPGARACAMMTLCLVPWRSAACHLAAVAALDDGWCSSSWITWLCGGQGAQMQQIRAAMICTRLIMLHAKCNRNTSIVCRAQRCLCQLMRPCNIACMHIHSTRMCAHSHAPWLQQSIQRVILVNCFGECCASSHCCRHIATAAARQKLGHTCGVSGGRQTNAVLAHKHCWHRSRSCDCSSNSQP
jgi:hypothetical protein